MTLDTKLYTLVKDLIGAETLIFADPNAPRPALPYWTLNVQTNKSLGSATYAQGVNTDGDLEVQGVREATVRITRLGADSVSLLSDFRDHSFRVTVLEKWQLESVSLYNRGDVQNTPFKLDNSQLEPRAVLDLFVRYGTSLLDRVGIIETVEIAASYEGNVDLDETITVDLGQ